MSIITRIKGIFSKPKSSDFIGIALRQHSIAFFAKKETENKCDSVEVKALPLVNTLKELVSEQALKGRCNYSVIKCAFTNCAS